MPRPQRQDFANRPPGAPTGSSIRARLSGPLPYKEVILFLLRGPSSPITERKFLGPGEPQ